MVLTLLFFHILAMGALFGGITIQIAICVALQRATNVDQVRSAMQHGPLVAPMMVGGVVLLLGMGIWMVYVGGFGWQPWVVVTLILTLLLGLAGKLINGGHVEALTEQVQAAGTGPILIEIDRVRRDPVWLYAVFAILFEIIAALYIMVNRPDVTACIGAVVVAAVVSVLPTMLALRRRA